MMYKGRISPVYLLEGDTVQYDKDDLTYPGARSGYSAVSGYSGQSGYTYPQVTQVDDLVERIKHKKLCPLCCGRGKVEKQGWFGKIKLVKCKCMSKCVTGVTGYGA